MKITLFLMFSLFINAASGLSCTNGGSFTRAYEDADVVMLVTATQATHQNSLPELTKLRIKEHFKVRGSYSSIVMTPLSIDLSESREKNTVYLLQPAFLKMPLEKIKIM